MLEVKHQKEMSELFQVDAYASAYFVVVCQGKIFENKYHA